MKKLVQNLVVASSTSAFTPPKQLDLLQRFANGTQSESDYYTLRQECLWLSDIPVPWPPAVRLVISDVICSVASYQDGGDEDWDQHIVRRGADVDRNAPETGMCWNGGGIERVMPFCPARDTVSDADDHNDDAAQLDSCKKQCDRHPRLISGLMLGQCAHDVNYGFNAMKNGEGSVMVPMILLTRFKKSTFMHAC